LYWKNPGGTGLETQASVFAPEGYRVGEALYPGPMRFRSGRGTVSYGYPSETALFVLLERLQSPGPSIPSFDVAASWLSCDHFCTKEGRRETITLGERPRENWESVANLSARLPRALPPDIDVLRPSSFELRVHGPKNTRLLEYFPIAPSIGDFEDVLQDRPDSRTLVVRSANSGALTEGVLSVTRNNVEAWYLITEQSRPSHPLGGRP
jgi:thiol:disulfide interchange protein DsbD